MLKDPKFELEKYMELHGTGKCSEYLRGDGINVNEKPDDGHSFVISHFF